VAVRITRAAGCARFPTLCTVESHLRLRAFVLAHQFGAPAKALAIDAGIALSYAYKILKVNTGAKKGK